MSHSGQTDICTCTGSSNFLCMTECKGMGESRPTPIQDSVDQTNSHNIAVLFSELHSSTTIHLTFNMIAL